MVITRGPKMCNFLDYKEFKIVYKRFASLYFITIVDKD
jgi:AP-1 complex subunit sigma 1/2